MWINMKVSLRIRLYKLCPSFNVILKYITGDHMFTSSHIFSGLISSTFVTYEYGLIQCILYLIFFRTYFNVIVPLVQHCVISNGPLNCVSFLYASWLFKNAFISDFKVVVNSFYTFIDIIFINLSLLYMKYYLPTYLVVYWENHIRGEY